MSIEQTIHGAWRISDVIDNRLISVVYYFTTKRQAMQSFREETAIIRPKGRR
jgi:hypothetical protein